MEALQLVLRFTDLSGRKATEKLYVETADVAWPNAAAAAIEAAINACSDCKILSHELVGADEVATGTATTNAYGDASDKLQITMKGATSGLIHRFDFACPKPAIFLTDNETPDEANADYAELRQWLVDNAKGSDGEALTYVGGRRVKTFHKK